MLTKRQKITISSSLLASSIFLLPYIDKSNHFFIILSIFIASYFVSIWSIYAAFSPYELASLFSLPVLLTVSFAIFFSKFEVSFGTGIILALTYVVVMYTILLSENIFNVCVERNIPLVRAARTVGYLATLFVTFAFFTLIFGLGLSNILFALIAFIASALLFAQGFWQIELKETNSRRLIYFSVVSGLIVSEVSWALSYWPLDPPKMGLALAACVYVVMGVLQHFIKEDLTRRTLFEYIFVAGSVLTLLVLSTSWGA